MAHWSIITLLDGLPSSPLLKRRPAQPTSVRPTTNAWSTSNPLNFVAPIHGIVIYQLRFGNLPAELFLYNANDG